MSNVCRKRQAPDQENCDEIHYNILQKMWRTLYRAVFWSLSLKTELLGVKVTINFHRQCHKNLISVQCVNCSGCVVTINFVILASNVTPLYPSKLALASLTGGGRSVGLDPHGLLRQGLLYSGFKLSNCGVRLQMHVSIPFFVHEVEVQTAFCCGV
jgi:hypothetical protein